MQLTPLSQIIKQGEVTFTIPKEYNVVAILKDWVTTTRSYLNNEPVLLIRRTIPSNNSVSVNIIPYGAIKTDNNNARQIGIIRLNIYGDIISDFISFERTEKTDISVTDNGLRILPLFRVTQKLPEIYIAKIRYEFEDTCDNIYLRELTNVIDSAIFCKDNKKVVIYYMAKTNENVIIALDSPSMYKSDIIIFDKQRGSLGIEPYEHLEEEAIL